MQAACALSYSVIFKLKAGGAGRKPHTHTPALAQGLGIIISCYWQQLCNSP